MGCVCKGNVDRSALRHVLAVLGPEPEMGPVLRDRIAEQFGCWFEPQTLVAALRALAEVGIAERLDLGPGRPALWARRDSPLLLGRRADGRPDLRLLRGGAA